MDFQVDLAAYRGPFDLLLYLVRKHEVDLADIPIARITDKYLEHLEVLQAIDVDAVGDFLDIASTLIEMKSRQVLPQVGEEAETIEDPHEQLIERLLEYKRYKDAASMLEERSRSWQLRFARVANDLPPRTISKAEQPIHEVELWDLVSALGRVLKERSAPTTTTIIYDDTPIHVYMKRIHEQLSAQQQAAFSDLFQPGMHKSAIVGIFLAVLELVRHHSVLAEQPDPHGEILLIPSADFDPSKPIEQGEEYSSGKILHDF
jgi:segregation and condensation protein A